MWFSKTEKMDINEKWVKLLQIPFFHIRSSDMHYYFLPALYLFLSFSISSMYWFYFWLDIREFTLSRYLDFLQKYRYEILLFMLPLLFMTFKLCWLIISSFGGILSNLIGKVDQKIWENVYKSIWRNQEILNYLNCFYRFEVKIEEKDLLSWPVYWHIFYYVMDYYYAQENVYDDLRKTIFIRNIIASNFILIILVFSIWLSLSQNIKTLIYIVLIWLLCMFLYRMYISLLNKYHRKLVLTFIYIYTNIENIWWKQ